MDYLGLVAQVVVYLLAVLVLVTVHHRNLKINNK